jgi:hypothetical protein
VVAEVGLVDGQQADMDPGQEHDGVLAAIGDGVAVGAGDLSR